MGDARPLKGQNLILPHPLPVAEDHGHGQPGLLPHHPGQGGPHAHPNPGSRVVPGGVLGAVLNLKVPHRGNAVGDAALQKPHPVVEIVGPLLPLGMVHTAREGYPGSVKELGQRFLPVDVQSAVGLAGLGFPVQLHMAEVEGHALVRAPNGLPHDALVMGYRPGTGIRGCSHTWVHSAPKANTAKATARWGPSPTLGKTKNTPRQGRRQPKPASLLHVRGRRSIEAKTQPLALRGCVRGPHSSQPHLWGGLFSRAS